MLCGLWGDQFYCRARSSSVVSEDRLITSLVTSTFINRNNFATYAGITLVTCIGVTMSMFRRRIEAIDGSVWERLAEAVITATGKGGYFLLCVFFISAALIMTGSRGGIFASMFGIVILGSGDVDTLKKSS